jgi:hypothetical protein
MGVGRSDWPPVTRCEGCLLVVARVDYPHQIGRVMVPSGRSRNVPERPCHCIGPKPYFPQAGVRFRSKFHMVFAYEAANRADIAVWVYRGFAGS